MSAVVVARGQPLASGAKIDLPSNDEEFALFLSTCTAALATAPTKSVRIYTLDGGRIESHDELMSDDILVCCFDDTPFAPPCDLLHGPQRSFQLGQLRPAAESSSPTVPVPSVASTAAALPPGTTDATLSAFPIRLTLNGSSESLAVVVADAQPYLSSFAALLAEASERCGAKAARLFTPQGLEVTNVDDILRNDLLLVAEAGEPYSPLIGWVDPASSSSGAASAAAAAAAAAAASGDPARDETLARFVRDSGLRMWDATSGANADDDTFYLAVDVAEAPRAAKPPRPDTRTQVIQNPELVTFLNYLDKKPS